MMQPGLMLLRGGWRRLLLLVSGHGNRLKRERVAPAAQARLGARRGDTAAPIFRPSARRDTTVTTPHQAIAQGIFDIVVERGSQLQRRCVGSDGICAYRDGSGSACYVGLLLSDDEAYGLKGGVTTLHDNGLLPERLRPHVKLLAQLQGIHDSSENWERDGDLPGWSGLGKGAPNRSRIALELRRVAHEHGLSDRLVETFYNA